jgi:hypothetical protein
VYSGEKIIKPGNPVKGDNVFLGWFLDNISFLEEWDFNNVPDGDLVLYAGWDGEDIPIIIPDKKPLTITGIGASGREYNGSDVIDDWWWDPENGDFIGLEEGDEVYIIAGPGIFLGTMADKNASVAPKPVTVNIPLYGRDADKYYLIQPDYVTVNIGQKPLTIASAEHSKEYDGSDEALDVNLNLSGVLPGDTVSYSNVIARYNSAEIGQTTLYIYGADLLGKDAGNYYIDLYYGPSEFEVEGILAELITFTVSFDKNGGTGNVPQPITVQQGHSATMPAKPDNLAYINGSITYTFNGWNTLEDGSGNNYAAGVPFTPFENTTLYARWILPNTVTLDLAQINDISVSVVANKTISVSDSGNNSVTFELPPGHGYSSVSWQLGGTVLPSGDSVTIHTSRQQLSLPGTYFLTLTVTPADSAEPFSKTIQITVVN